MPSQIVNEPVALNGGKPYSQLKDVQQLLTFFQVTNGAKKPSQDQSNKVFVLEKQGKFGYSSRPKPTVDSRYVLVKVLVTGLCGSDVSSSVECCWETN
jgi:hypothetical protein